MFKYLIFARSGLSPAKNRDEHGKTGFGDYHTNEEWAAFNRALHSHFKRTKRTKMNTPLRIVAVQ